MGNSDQNWVKDTCLNSLKLIVGYSEFSRRFQFYRPEFQLEILVQFKGVISWISDLAMSYLGERLSDPFGQIYRPDTS